MCLFENQEVYEPGKGKRVVQVHNNLQVSTTPSCWDVPSVFLARCLFKVKECPLKCHAEDSRERVSAEGQVSHGSTPGMSLGEDTAPLGGAIKTNQNQMKTAVE